MKIIETKNLLKRFDGVCAVNHLSIGIEKGHITGIIGPNGSGKTTLINLWSGMLPMDGGEIIVEETEKFTRILPHQVYFYGITRTFQNIRLFEQMTILDNILVVLTERNVFSSLFEKHMKYHLKKAEEVLQKIGLWEKRNQLAINLSYGQRKLLEIARALAMKSEIYLLDEPFAGLFPEMRKIVADIIRELKQENKTVILIEHDMGLIRELCDYIFVMDEGKLLAEGKPESVLEKKEVIEAYLGE
jgi:branched-chain amino acid transport system ATP-binding protein